MRPLSVRLDVPDAFRAKAWYALEELLAGLGLTPVDAGASAPALVYGAAPVPDTAHLAFDAAAPAFLSAVPARAPAPAAYAATAEGALPVAFGTAEAPDVVASSFLWLSGAAETHAPHDAHGRPPFEASLAHRWGTAAMPVVDRYRALLAEQLRAAGTDVPRPGVAGAPWAVCITCDVDHVRYGRLRRVARALLARDAAEAARAFRAWRRPAADPFRRALVHLADTTAAHGGHATLLFKAGAADPHDVPYRLDAPWLQRLARRLQAEGHELALHPGYATPARADLMAAEVRTFEAAFGTRPVSVRQHYLRHAGAATARLHIANGLRVDNTLGWTATPGFRRGTTHPFHTYDLDADAPLPLVEVPLAWMDTGAFEARGLSPEAAWAETLPLLEAARQHGGVFAGLWHNTFHGPEAPAAQHLARTLAYAVQHGAALVPLRSFADRAP